MNARTIRKRFMASARLHGRKYAQLVLRVPLDAYEVKPPPAVLMPSHADLTAPLMRREVMQGLGRALWVEQLGAGAYASTVIDHHVATMLPPNSGPRARCLHVVHVGEVVSWWECSRMVFGPHGAVIAAYDLDVSICDAHIARVRWIEQYARGTTTRSPVGAPATVAIGRAAFGPGTTRSHVQLTDTHVLFACVVDTTNAPSVRCACRIVAAALRVAAEHGVKVQVHHRVQKESQ